VSAESGSEAFSARIEAAQQRLREAAESADSAEKRATAEIRALEADLETAKLRGAEALEELRETHERELRAERDSKERAIAAAEERLSEIEAQAESAEKRVEAAERRVSEAEDKIADSEAKARSAAASWLRGQVDAIRREAAGK
jgi:chromosome segregation ATPase